MNLISIFKYNIYMNSALIVSIVSSLITLVFMYLDTKVFDNPKTKFTYFKNMVLVFAKSYCIVYFMGNPNISDMSGLSQMGGTGMLSTTTMPSLAQAGTSFVSDINQEIMTGIPNF